MQAQHKQLIMDTIISLGTIEIQILARDHRKFLHTMLEHFPQRPTSVVVLHQAIREGITKDILLSASVSGVVAERYAKRLSQQTGISMDWSLWAVQQWSMLLGQEFAFEKKSIRTQSILPKKQQQSLFSRPSTKMYELQGHRKALTSIDFSSNGKWLVTSGLDRSIRLWESKNGKLLASFLGGHRDWIRSVCFQPEKPIFCSGGDDGTCRLWDLQTGKQIHTLQGHHGWVHVVQFSHDGGLLASGASDGTLCIWQLDTMEQVLRLATIGAVYSVGFSFDGCYIAIGSVGSIEIWEIKTQKRIHKQSFRGEKISVLFLPDASLFVASAQGLQRIFPLGTEKVIHFMGHDAGVLGVIKDSSSPSVLSFGEDKTIRFWDERTGRAVWKMDIKQNINDIALSIDGKLGIALSSNKGILCELEREL